MDVRDGRIYRAEDVSVMPAEDQQFMKEMEYLPTPYQHTTGRVGRNDPCPCGSGKKFKKCHLFRSNANAV